MNNEPTESTSERHLVPSNRYYFTRDVRPDHEERFTTLNQNPPDMPNLNPPHQEESPELTSEVYIKAKIVKLNGEKSYYISDGNINEMSHEVLKEILIELINEQHGK